VALAAMARRIETGSIDIDAIKDQFPLADEVRRHLVLKHRGQTLVGLCPFHMERTPSFTVYPQDQRYNCFGCGANGDVFDFLHHQDGLDIRAAAEHLTGGTLPVLSEARVVELRQQQARFEAEQAARRKAAAEQMRLRWEAADPAFSAHPYLAAKGIGPNGTRLDRQHILVPLFDTAGALRSLQSIDPAGHKLFEADLAVAGAMFVIGQPVAVATGPVLVCEGFATGASLYEATGRTVVVTLNAGNLTKVAERLVIAHPKTRWLVAGDDDRGKPTNVGRDAAVQAARILRCHAVFPVFPEGSDGTDFNDMAAHYGALAVLGRVLNGAPPGDAMPSSPADTGPRLLTAVDAFDFDPAKIPVRPWLVPGLLIRCATHVLVAPGGSGKSLFNLQKAIMLATGIQWGEWKPRSRYRSLVINAEDDIDEQRRRLTAALKVMNPPRHLLDGMVHLADDPHSLVVVRVDPRSRQMITTPMAGAITAYVREHKIDVLIVDPFAETFEGDENSNSEIKWAMKVWRDIARDTNCAVVLVHHTVKYASGGAGNADIVRGGGAIVNSTRISATLMTMTEDEAKVLGIAEDERFRYVRHDDAKANWTLKSGKARWFEKVSVTLENGTGLVEPDQVGALVPWKPPSAYAGVSVLQIQTALAAIDRGLDGQDGKPSGVLYTERTNSAEGTSSERWAGKVLISHLGVGEARAKIILKDWLSNGVLVRTEFTDPRFRKTYKGLRVDLNNIPGTAEGGYF
jgi:hypothetical protein